MELTIGANGWEDFRLDGGWAELNTVENGWVENVDTSVDSVSYELDWFLNESVNARGVSWLVDNDTVLAWFFNLGDDDGSLLSMGFVEFGQIGKWVVANDIGVEDKEWVIVLSENLFGELKRTGGTEWFVLNAKGDSDIVFFLVLF